MNYFSQESIEARADAHTRECGRLIASDMFEAFQEGGEAHALEVCEQGVYELARSISGAWAIREAAMTAYRDLQAGMFGFKALAA